MNIQTIYEDDHFLAVQKPNGISTHSPDGKTPGLVEFLEQEKNIKLGVHQRLDATTSGVIVFSKSGQGAQRLGKAFELRNIKKTYRALVCGIPESPQGILENYLLYTNGKTEENSKGKLAKARYRIIAQAGPFALLELDLLTGMTHQLRAQCALAGFPILGDALYGGGNLAPRLYLHAMKLRITSEPNLPTMISKPPKLLDEPLFENILAAIFSAPRLKTADSQEAIRLFAPQHSGIPEIIAEKIASVLLVRHLEPATRTMWQEGSLRAFFNVAKKFFHCTQTCYKIHESPNAPHVAKPFARAFPNIPDPVVATEHLLKYRFDFSGNAVGLYLDQRENRQWIIEHAKGKVVNLFAYTCAFSICAASNPNVSSVESIDSANAALNRGRANFELNGLYGPYKFIPEDAMKYLNKCVQNGIAFDTVICDPPSFGRAGKRVFSLEESLEALIALCIQATAKGGVLLFSINHRKIRLPRLKDAWKNALITQKRTPRMTDIFVNDKMSSILGVGTDLKTIRAQF